MKPQYLIGYFLTAVLVVWSLVSQNYEFMIYAAAVLVLVVLLHSTQKIYHFKSGVLWAFVAWIIMHILGGLLPVGNGVLYSKVLIPIIGEPYEILKYDQVVHAYCYTVVALLLWPVVMHVAKPENGHKTLVFLTVLAATGIGGLNEIVEFIATLTVPETNVGGYENTAIDIVANLLGALLAIPFLKRPNKADPM
ncbi:MAG: DUF2238 domain-containing protein [Gammaproteobacteria bacterium]|nr:DUF2238 domain-containing protein [Gammaproteobacteria bacterium]NNC98531.1 DUF2238 domain-containing protein [Gammaproteobacteria bacterium]NNM14153.1 DUF2238 domain-containing protein [Gammaproteobacteria bacterium]